MRRLFRFGLLVVAVGLASTGCDHKPWLRQQDEDELPPRGAGLKGTNSNSGIIGSNSGDQTSASSFFDADRPVGGMSSKAQSIERNLGAY